MADHYADGTYLWWHLSRPSPELLAALGEGWLPGSGRGLDVGCGLGVEAGYLASAGWQVAGIDLSETAARRAAAEHGDVVFVRADVRRLPFAPECFDAAVDRGCFHYLRPDDRPRYSDELRRVLRPGGKYLLRASLRAAGVRNDIDEAVIAATFAAWTIEHMERAKVPSDTRMLEMIVARMSAPRYRRVRGSRSATDGYT
jgi:SAM-dependent methyltransferase